jgi:pimeloyl-ACP methyl ester carboxylesterase
MQGWQLSAAAAALSLAIHKFVMPYAGRIVRYTRASPDNIAARKAIRERGLSLLTDLHSADYDRIIVVGHSLGSILGYDLIAYFWASRMKARTIAEGTPEFDALRDLQKGINGLKSPSVGQDVALIAYGRAQTALARLLRMRPKPKESDRKSSDDASDARWLITDFVTLGSPLTHAEFLLANNKEALSRRQRDREFPTCPPFGEQLEDASVKRALAAGFELDEEDPGMISFPFGSAGGWQLHHAAPFAAVRWTNIYDPALLVVCGDIVSGPLRPAFGQGITDVNLKELRGQNLAFSHAKYWSLKGAEATVTPVHIRELRSALDLAGKSKLL